MPPVLHWSTGDHWRPRRQVSPPLRLPPPHSAAKPGLVEGHSSVAETRSPALSFLLGLISSRRSKLYSWSRNCKRSTLNIEHGNFKSTCDDPGGQTAIRESLSIHPSTGRHRTRPSG